MPPKEVILCNSMISNHTVNEFIIEVAKTFMKMQLAGVKPHCHNFVGMLPTCAKIGALEQGMHPGKHSGKGISVIRY